MARGRIHGREDADIPVRAVIVDDDDSSREGLSVLLNFGGISIVGTTNNFEAFIELVEQHHPDVVIMDLRPTPFEADGSQGLKAVEQLLAKAPETKVIVRTSYPDFSDFIRALRLGVAAFIPKGGDEMSPAAVARHVIRGGTHYPQRFLQHMAELIQMQDQRH